MVDPKVAIIISTYNQKKLLEESLESLKKNTTYKKYRVYVVDDSGKKGEMGAEIKKKFKWANIIINKENKGFSGANNVGIKKAMNEYNPEYILLLNDDIEIIEKNWLKRIIDEGERDKQIGILGCKILYPDRSLQNMGGYIKKWKIELEKNENKKDIFEVDHVMGAFILIKKEVIKKIGLLDEIYSPYLLEDTDYCLRVKKMGWKVVSVPYVSIIHKKGKSIDSLEDKKKLLVRFKNDIIFSKRHLRGWNKFFRIYIYLPLVAIFKKQKDTDNLSLRKVTLRKKVLRNLGLWFMAFFPKWYKKRLK